MTGNLKKKVRPKLDEKQRKAMRLSAKDYANHVSFFLAETTVNVRVPRKPVFYSHYDDEPEWRIQVEISQDSTSWCIYPGQKELTDWMKKDILSKRVFALKCAEYLKKDTSTNAFLLDALI